MRQVERELDWVRHDYNQVKLHAAVGYVTPDDEHTGRGEGIRQARRDDAMTPIRDDIDATSREVCPVCGARFRRIRRQLYCSATCKQRAWPHQPT